MKQNIKPGDVISFPSLEEMCPRYVRTERKEFDLAIRIVDIYEINCVKNGKPATIELQSNLRYEIKTNIIKK